MAAGERLRRDSWVVRNDEPVAVEVDRTVVMLSIVQGMYYGMEGAGRRIWALLEQPRTVSDLCQQLLEEFDVDPGQCETDVRQFLEELQRADLIRIDDQATDPTDSASER